MMGLARNDTHAQTISPKVSPTSGGYYQAGGISLSWTMGETYNTTTTGGATMLTRGEQQPYNASLQAKAMLAGPYIGPLMHDSLRVKNQIPTTEPYSTNPYNNPAIGGPSGETVSGTILNITGHNAIVDWVYLELRDASNPSLIVASKRALIQRDGDIVSATDGTSAIYFPTVSQGSYYVTLKHRNHIGTTSSSSLKFDGIDASFFDFTTSPVYVNPLIVTNTPLKPLNGINLLWPADANHNKNVRYNGLSNDKQKILDAVGGAAYVNSILSGVYRMEDINMDGKICYNGLDNDRNVILGTVGVNTPNTILYQHTPN